MFFSDRLRRKALREDRRLRIYRVHAARAMEIADAQAKAVENPSILRRIQWRISGESFNFETTTLER
jgi:hypothetical protein